MDLARRMTQRGCAFPSNEQLLLTALASEGGPQAGRYYLNAPQQNCGRLMGDRLPTSEAQ